MLFKVKNKHETELDKYECKGGDCEHCGLKFVCYTERDKSSLDWGAFVSILKGTFKPEITFRGKVS